MSRPSHSVVILACLSLVGCSGYHYMKEVSPELQNGRQEYVVNNPGNHYNPDILNGRVKTGMSRLQVRIAWGEPDLVTPRGGGTEVWSYQEDEPSRGTSVYHLRFKGEQLTAVDTDRGEGLSTATETPMTADQTEEIAPTTRTSTVRKPGGDFH